MMKLKLYFLLFFIGLQWAIGQVPALKNPNKAVQDYVNLLSDEQQNLLNEKLRHYADSTSTGIVIAILPTTDDDINYQAAEILAKWGIGQKGKDNGILILMAYQQRKVAISTGYGVEEYLTDALSKQIISQDMIPNFKMGNYYQGFDSATTSIMQVLSGTYKRNIQQQESPSFIMIIVFAIFVIVIISVIAKGKKGGGNNYGGGNGFDIFDVIILSSMGRNSGGFGNFGGGSGGGFGGFGGGMGGGGGASGSW